MLAATVAEYLRGRDHDAVADVEIARLVGSPDSDALDWATRRERVVVTRNVIDFVQLDRQWISVGRQHSGIVYVSSKTFPMTRGSKWQVSAALDVLAKAKRLPAPGHTSYL